MLKIAIAQIEIKPGKFKDNINCIIEYINKAKSEGADLVVFPELCVSGKYLGDTFYNLEVINELNNANELIKNESRDIGVIWGNVYYGNIDNSTNKHLLNAAYFAYNGEYLLRDNNMYSYLYIKSQNDDSRINSDTRYFADSAALKQKGYDVSFNEKYYNFKDYHISLMINDDLFGSYTIKADYCINLCQNIWTINAKSKRKNDAQNFLTNNNIANYIEVNNVGCQNTGKNVLVFAGESKVYKENTLVMNLNGQFKQEIKVYNGNQDLTSNVDAELIDTLVYGIKKFDEQMFSFKPKWIIGLSGGLDSSVNAALLVKALGKERVIGYNLATEFNSSTTKNNAHKLADALGIEIRNGYISQLVDATKEVVYNYGYKTEDISVLTEENIQARIRGHVLSTFAAIHSGVVCNNGNKVEAGLGYFTLYGDSIGALCPIGDLLKTQLFELSAQINKKEEIIPVSLLPEEVEGKIKWEMPPSAELKNNQVDPMKWYYHDYLINYLTESNLNTIENFVEKYLYDRFESNEELSKWIKYYNLDDVEVFFNDLEWLVNTINKAAFKRIQLPPNILISDGAFGSDRREVQMNLVLSDRYQELKKECFKKFTI